jgi:acylphosphatase
LTDIFLRSKKNMNKHYHIYFSGQVQGIGFRYAALNAANRYGVNGWVRNCRDGKVEIEAEGSPDDLNNLLNHLESEFGSYIKKVDRKELAAGGERKGFEIKY